MAYLSIDEYKRREAAANRRMDRNRKIDTLAAEQHDALASLCAVRHKLHSTPNVGGVLFNDEAADNQELWNVLDTENHTNDLLAALIEAGLPALDWTCDGTDYDTAFCWPNVYGTEITDGEREAAVIALFDLVAEFNRACESYLRRIDEVYGTSYAPTGALRK